jgi:hypothetical protein
MKKSCFLVALGLFATIALHVPAKAQPDGKKPLHLVICVTEGKGQLLKYKSYLETNFHVRCSVVGPEERKDKDKKDKKVETPFVGLEALADADVILSNLYRTSPTPEHLAILKKAFLSKPVVGMRKAHHGFQNWLDVSKEVFGVNYRGHYFGKDVTIEIVAKQKGNPLLAGVTPFLPGGGLYQHTEIASDVEALMVGGPAGKEKMPQMWQRIIKDRGNQRALYTRYDPNDLDKNPPIRDMVTRAIFWAVERDGKSLQK